MKKYLFVLLACLSSAFLSAQIQVNPKAFELLDLNRKGLEKVKKEYEKGKLESAAKHLLTYYRTRTNFTHPDLNLKEISVNATEQKWADDALKHVFFAHKGYQPSYFYGDNIDWTYWPVKDNELRWQLHRTKWWQPMGKVYYTSKDEKYAKEWVFQYMDWIKKNPLEDFINRQQVGADVESLPNSAFAWRALEVSHRLQDQIAQFMLFINSKHFTPAFLTQFLVNYESHAQHILSNYSAQGNHLLFEAQRVLYAGTSFPEFKEASKWRASGIQILNDEIGKQVFADGGQYELDLGYHLAAINIFSKALRMAQVNGFADEFPASYSKIIHDMIVVTMNMYYPNYTNPLFSDAKMGSANSLIANYQEFAKLFPEDENILYFATEGKEGKAPSYLSKAFQDSGFYVFRNGWTPSSIQMDVKAGPAAHWHNQPDNGTFELYINERNFFPDSGSYVYGGSEEVLKQREWFRQTKVHNTLSLNGENLSSNSKCLFWSATPTTDVLTVENTSYPELNHRRTFFFVEKKFFVIFDEAIGTAKGDVALHFNFLEGDMIADYANHKVATPFTDGNNLVVQSFGPADLKMEKQEGWVSYAYRQKAERDAFSFIAEKATDAPVQFITVLIPTKSADAVGEIKAEYVDGAIHVEFNGNTYNLNTPIQ